MLFTSEPLTPRNTLFLGQLYGSQMSKPSSKYQEPSPRLLGELLEFSSLRKFIGWDAFVTGNDYYAMLKKRLHVTKIFKLIDGISGVDGA